MSKPKFKVGDRVTLHADECGATVREVVFGYNVEWDDQPGTQEYFDEDELIKLKPSEDERFASVSRKEAEAFLKTNSKVWYIDKLSNLK